MTTLSRMRWLLGCLTVLVILSLTGARALDVNLRGYGTPPAQPGTDVSAQLQAAIDAVSAAGGGNVQIPGDTLPWCLYYPVFVNSGNVTIQGIEGKPDVSNYGIMGGMPGFFLGLSRDPRNASNRGITTEHYPAVAMDGSAGTRYGLRTRDSQGTTAFGYFHQCPFSHGVHSCSNYGGVDTPSYWQPPRYCQNGHPYDNWAKYQYTLDLAVKNNAAGTLQGTLCGIGAPTTTNDMTDRSMVWLVATDPAAGNNLVYKFKLQDGSVQSISFNAAITDTNIHRLTVQMDLTRATGTGNQCVVWLDGVLKNKLLLPGGTRLNEFTYGAFRLGDVTASALTGNAGAADWTFCGLKLEAVRLYDDTLGIGSAQTILGGGTPNDSFRYFTATGNTCAYLPLDYQPTANYAITCVRYGTGEHGNVWGYGLWLPDRPSAPVAGPITVTHLTTHGFGNIFTLGEATDVHFSIIDGPNGPTYNTFSSLECPTYCTVDIAGVDIAGCGDTFYRGSNQYLSMYKCTAYPARTAFCLHGVNGSINGCMVNDPYVKVDYYVKNFAGPGSGPFTIQSMQFDNEWAPVPTKGFVYYEGGTAPVTGASATPCNNGLTIHTMYPGVMPDSCVWVDLGDTPNMPANKAGVLTVTGIGAWPYSDRIAGAVRTNSPSTRWTGTVYDCFSTIPVKQWVTYTGGSGSCGIVCKHPDFTGGPTGGPSPSNYFGMRFTVGGSNLTITDLGRWCFAGDSSTHRLVIVRDSDLAIVADTNLAMAGGTAGQFKYATLTPAVTLNANTTYYLLSYESNTSLDTWGDRYNDDFTCPAYTTTAAASVSGSAYTTALTNRPATWNDLTSFGPLNFKYSGTSFVTSAVPGRLLNNGQWLQGCHSFDIHHPVPDGSGNAYVEYQCTGSGAPGTWIGVGKVN